MTAIHENFEAVVRCTILELLEREVRRRLKAIAEEERELGEAIERGDGAGVRSAVLRAKNAEAGLYAVLFTLEEAAEHYSKHNPRQRMRPSRTTPANCIEEIDA